MAATHAFAVGRILQKMAAVVRAAFARRGFPAGWKVDDIQGQSEVGCGQRPLHGIGSVCRCGRDFSCNFDAPSFAERERVGPVNHSILSIGET